MTGAALEELDRALDALERLARADGRPSRHEARAILVPLGTALAEGAKGTEARIARLRQAVERLRESWEAAVHEELSLACAEHVQAVDPRYLGLPDYDFDYTVGARARLQARLRAAEALGIEAPRPLWLQVEQADAVLKDYLRAREPGSEGGGNGSSRP